MEVVNVIPYCSQTCFPLTTVTLINQTILRPANSWISSTTYNETFTYHVLLNCPFDYCLSYPLHLKQLLIYSVSLRDTIYYVDNAQMILVLYLDLLIVKMF